MSISAVLYVYFEKALDIVSLIDDLLQSGWSYDDHGKISYLPIHDEGSFNWQVESLENWDKVKPIIVSKIELEELVGLALTWNDSSIGGEILASPRENYVSFSLSINRKVLDDGRSTDFSWYEERFIEPLRIRGYKIREVRRKQTD